MTPANGGHRTSDSSWLARTVPVTLMVSKPACGPGPSCRSLLQDLLDSPGAQAKVLTMRGAGTSQQDGAATDPQRLRLPTKKEAAIVRFTLNQHMPFPLVYHNGKLIQKRYGYLLVVVSN